ncbi:MAG: hypothetical protein KatS3mg124_0723 [Porticoccaceae bacterium]|nr:MAG: hypothetical protein KatS3mg124_0723 [Porticoccaceae bacterium]
MAALPLPASLEEVTPAWLTAAVRTRHPAAVVKACEVVEVIHGTCTKVRLALSLAGSGDIPSALVLKAGFEPHSDSMYPTLEKEVRAWRELLPHLPLHTPRCHFAAYEPERRLAAVLMDDLVARGVRFCHPLRPASPAQVARRLAALARFHAASLGSPRLAPGGEWAWVPDILEAAVTYFAPFLEAATFARYAALPRAAAAPAAFVDRHWLREALASLVALSRERAPRRPPRRHPPGQPLRGGGWHARLL